MDKTSNGSNSALVRRVHQLLKHFNYWHIRHIPKENNQDADRLVKLAHHRTFDLCLYEEGQNPNNNATSVTRTQAIPGMVNALAIRPTHE
ncbi:hypothetical protein Gotur_002605, partial [Gossypium turneri]